MTAKQTPRAWWWRFADAVTDNWRDVLDGMLSGLLAGAVVLCALTAFGLFLWSYA